jgi:transcriptional regulator with XRE-family HTH domain
MPIGPKNKLEILPEIQGSVLKAAREKLRLEIPDLATKACLSKKHITELEQGGISSFYSESHKITVAKKVAKILQLDESLILVHPDGDVAQQESLPFDAVMDDADQPKPEEAKVTKEATVIAPETKPALEEQKQATAHSTPKSANKSEANQPNQTSKVTLENLQSGGQMDSSKPKTKRSRSALLSVLLLILVAGGLYSSKDDIIALFNPPAEEPQALVVEGAAPQDTKEEGSNPANTVAPAAPAPAPANPSAPSSAAPAAANVAAVVPFPSDVGCPKPDANVADQSVTEPGKPGNFVYVHVKSRQIVCVVDATGKSMMQSIEAGSGHTYGGKAPFTVLTNGLSQTSVYFQGRLARPINEQARTMRLVDVPFN